MNKLLKTMFFCSLLNNAFCTEIPQTVQENSLLYHNWSHYSQYGEEGILDHILTTLEIDQGFFVEFGGWDGIHLSNTRFLAEKGWAGAFIEADPELSLLSEKNSAIFSNVMSICEFVMPKKSRIGKTLDQIAQEFFPNTEIDVLSIDIDGADYLILESLKLKPKVIIIEGGINWHPLLTHRIPDLVAKNQINQPLSVIFDIAKKKGYQPVCYTINTFLVRDDLYQPFETILNDPVNLWFDSWHYFKNKSPEISSYITEVRKSDPWIKHFDNYTFDFE